MKKNENVEVQTSENESSTIRVDKDFVFNIEQDIINIQKSGGPKLSKSEYLEYVYYLSLIHRYGYTPKEYENDNIKLDEKSKLDFDNVKEKIINLLNVSDEYPIPSFDNLSGALFDVMSPELIASANELLEDINENENATDILEKKFDKIIQNNKIDSTFLFENN